MPGIISDLTVAGALFLRASARKLLSKNEPEPDLDKYSAAMQNLLNRAPEGLIKDYKWLDIPGNCPPWVASGLSLEIGDEISCFMAGRVFASKPLDIWLSLALQVWYKVGSSPMEGHGCRVAPCREVRFLS